jgi:siroheme synthase-like protein
MFPAMLRLDGVDTLVVGGGPVAARRAAALAENGAKVSVVAPSACEAMRRLVASEGVVWQERGFERGDVDGKRVVVAATDTPATNIIIADAARSSGAWVNVADDASHGDLHFPATARRGRMTVAISTDGVSPLVSRRIREGILDEYGDEFAQLLDLLADTREEARASLSTQPARKRFYEAVLDSDIGSTLKAGNPRAARERVAELLDRHAGRQA